MKELKEIRTPIKQRGITYHLTFAQIAENRDGKNTRNFNDLELYFNSLPFKEKLKVRPDWQPPPDESYYPDPEWE